MHGRWEQFRKTHPGLGFGNGLLSKSSMSHCVPERSVTPWPNYTKSGPSHPSLPSSKDRSKTNAKAPLSSLHWVPPMTPDLYWTSLDLLSSSTWCMSVSDKEFFSPDFPPLAYSTPAKWGHCSSLGQQASLAYRHLQLFILSGEHFHQTAVWRSHFLCSNVPFLGRPLQLHYLWSHSVHSLSSALAPFLDLFFY